ncbi:hypothetical protein ACF0H5_020831 [Mactra antiquata]
MSFVHRLFRKSKKKRDEPGNREADDTLLTIESVSSTKACETSSPQNTQKTNLDEERTVSHVGNPDIRSEEGSMKSGQLSSSSSTSDIVCKLDNVSTTQQRRLLRQQVHKLGKEEKKLKRYQRESLALDDELNEVTTLISRVQIHNSALSDDILNKKCELNFLHSAVPDDYDTEAKATEPVFYKKYSNVKSAEESKNLLQTIRKKIKALEYIELMVYDKYVDFNHDLKSDSIQTQSNFLMKNKRRHFGHLTDTIEHKRKNRADKRARGKIKPFDAANNAIEKLTTVTIESLAHPLESSPDDVSTSPPLSGPAVPLAMYNPLTMAAICNARNETTL